MRIKIGGALAAAWVLAANILFYRQFIGPLVEQVKRLLAGSGD